MQVVGACPGMIGLWPLFGREPSRRETRLIRQSRRETDLEGERPERWVLAYAGDSVPVSWEAILTERFEALRGLEAVELTLQHRPDVVLLDVHMPDMSGLVALERIMEQAPESRVVMLTATEKVDVFLEAIANGAAGYLNKTTADRSLIEAIRVVARGEVFLPPQATKLLLKEYKAMGSGGGADELHPLSAREQEVMALTAEGFSSKEIGEKLFISPKTVDTYRSRIMEKLGLNHRSELVRFALRAGLLKET